MNDFKVKITGTSIIDSICNTLFYGRQQGLDFIYMDKFVWITNNARGLQDNYKVITETQIRRYLSKARDYLEENYGVTIEPLLVEETKTGKKDKKGNEIMKRNSKGRLGTGIAFRIVQYSNTSYSLDSVDKRLKVITGMAKKINNTVSAISGKPLGEGTQLNILEELERIDIETYKKLKQ